VAGKLVRVVEGGDTLERGFKRSQPLLFDQAGIHAGGKVVAILLFKWVGGVGGGSVQFLPQQVTVALLE
jgi:hypothetical protein